MEQGLRKSRCLPGLTARGPKGLQPDLPALEPRGPRALAAHIHGLGRLINFFDRQGALFGDWGRVLLLTPAVLAAVMLEEAAEDFPPEGGRPARLAALAEADEGRVGPERAAAMEALIEVEFDWQQKWRQRLKEAGVHIKRLTFNPRHRPDLPPGEFPDFRWYLGAALNLGASRLIFLNWAEATWKQARTEPDGGLPPHLGQIMAVLDGLENLRPLQNQLVPLHTEYFYLRVLGAQPQAPAADRVLVCFQSDSDFLTLPVGQRLATGGSPPLLFQLEEETPVSSSRLAGLLAIEPSTKSGPWARARRWPPDETAPAGNLMRPLFPEAAVEELQSGSTRLNLPGLNLPGGRRAVAIFLELAEDGHESSTDLRRAWDKRPDAWLKLELSLESGWFSPPDWSIDLEDGSVPSTVDSPKPLTGEGSADQTGTEVQSENLTGPASPRLVLRFTLPPDAPSPAPPAGATLPVLRLSPRPLESDLWAVLASFRLTGVSFQAEVRGRTDFNIILDGHARPNSPDAAVEIFGPRPGPGAALHLELPPSNGGRLEWVRLNWQPAGPEDFAHYFRAYNFKPLTLQPAARPAADGWQDAGPPVPWLGRALDQLQINPPPLGEAVRFSLSDQGDLLGHEAYSGLLARLTLEETSLMRRLRASLTGRPRLRDLNPPHTPAWTGLNLDYAVTDRYGPEVLEHRHPWEGYIDLLTVDQAGGDGVRAVRLLPHYDCPVLALGLVGVKAAELKRPVSLYFHLQNLAPGREDFDPAWIGADLSRDETQGLTRSGLVLLTLNQAALKGEAEGSVWVNLRWPRPAEPTDSTEPSVPALALQGVHEHVAWAVFDLETWLAEGEPERPWPLPAGSLTAWPPPTEERPLPEPTPLQPYPSAGGRPRGSGRSADFWQDQAEELSHRGQAVLPRDYERLVLREFPEILAVKCLPHTDDRLHCGRAGHTALIVFAPQAGAPLHLADGGFRLSPELPAYADDQLLTLIYKFLAGRASPLINIHTLQPCFQAVTPVLRGALAPWKNQAEARAEAAETLGRFLAPWAFEPDRATFSRPLDQAELEDQLRTLPWLLKLHELELRTDGGPLRPDRPDVLFYIKHPQIELEIE